MRLAELLNERKAAKQEIKLVKRRLDLSAKMQEGDKKPVESPEELKRALVELYAKLKHLIVKINNTNMEPIVEGKTLMELIAERDQNMAIAAALHDLAENATPQREGFSRNEIRYIPAIDVKSIRHEADIYAKMAREIDNKIQAVNWNIEVE